MNKKLFYLFFYIFILKYSFVPFHPNVFSSEQHTYKKPSSSLFNSYIVETTVVTGTKRLFININNAHAAFKFIFIRMAVSNCPTVKPLGITNFDFSTVLLIFVKSMYTGIESLYLFKIVEDCFIRSSRVYFSLNWFVIVLLDFENIFAWFNEVVYYRKRWRGRSRRDIKSYEARYIL